MLSKNSKIYVAGQKYLLAKAIARQLLKEGYSNMLKEDYNYKSQKETDEFFRAKKPEYVFLPHLRSGGILANTRYPAELFFENISGQTNIINAAFNSGSKKLLFLASPCSYPKVCQNPIKEESLMQGPLEETSKSYALAKLAGIQMCKAYNSQRKTNFIAAIPTNIFGPEDDFSEDGHVIAGLIKKFHKANQAGGDVRIWGTGKPKREFLYVDDVASACIFLMKKYDGPDLINIGGGKELSIRQLADILKNISGFKGKIIYETEKPDGMKRRALNSEKISKLGWSPKIEIKEGILKTYQWYSQNYARH